LKINGLVSKEPKDFSAGVWFIKVGFRFWLVGLGGAVGHLILLTVQKCSYPCQVTKTFYRFCLLYFDAQKVSDSYIY
jgi:hypothetical protein